MIETEQLSAPAVRAFVAAGNAGDREAFYATLAPGATMSDDGTERDLDEWVDREPVRDRPGVTGADCVLRAGG
jgi:hypothetical protein